MGILSEIGIKGWEKVEALILSAIAANKSVLFIGNPGGAKTFAAELLSRAFLGKACIFRHYEVPSLSFEDLSGFLNPDKLKDGKLDFVETPLSIWGCTAALFDEVNGCNPFLQNKLHELIRQQKYMGLKTDLKLVFGAVNPPNEFQTAHMTQQFASRWVSVWIPSLSKNYDVLSDILGTENNPSEITVPDLSEELDKIRRINMPTAELEKIDRMVRAIVEKLHQHEFIYEGRSAKQLRSLIIGYQSCQAVFGSRLHTSNDTLADLVVSTVPELNAITRRASDQNDVNAVKSEIQEIVSEYKLDDPAILTTDLISLIKQPVSDKFSWGESIAALVERQDKTLTLKKAYYHITKKIGLTSQDVRAPLASIIKRATVLTLAEDSTVSVKQKDVAKVVRDVQQDMASYRPSKKKKGEGQSDAPDAPVKKVKRKAVKS